MGESATISATLYTGYADNRTYPDWALTVYCRQTASAAGFSDAFIIAEDIMETTPDDRMMDIGAFMKSFCDDFLPETPPDRANFN